MFVYSGLNIWHAAVAYFDGVTIEQFTKPYDVKGKTTKRNTKNKVESIKEMPCL